MPVNITNGSLTAAAARKPNVPALPATPSYYTTIGQARTALNGVGPDEPGTGVRFAAGKGYYLGAAPKQAATPSAGSPSLAQAAGPFTPFQQTVSGYVNQLPAPLTDQQINQRAQAELSPLVKALTTNVNTRTQAGDNAITGYTKDAIAKLAGLNWTAPYQGAEQQQASADAALQQSLNGQGTSDAQGLASRLAVLGDPSVTQAANNVAGNGAANGTTQVAQGTSALSNLIAQAAAAGSYGEKQPGIARTAGLQDLATNEQNANNNIATQTQALQAQLPQILSDLRSQSDSRAQNRASLGEDLTKYLTSRSDAINAGTSKNNAAVQVATIKAQTAQETAAAKAAQTNYTNRLAFAKTYKYDPVTKQPLPGYTVDPRTGAVEKAPTASAKKAATPGEIQSFVNSLKTPVYTNVSKSDGAGDTVSTKTQTGVTYKMTFPQAYKLLRAKGVDDQTARQELQPVYPRGVQGRGWLTNEEQSVLQSDQAKMAGPATGNLTTVRKFQGHGYLSAPQEQALRAAHALPAGERGYVNGNAVWYIAPGR